ncbi:hypothetical protein Tco_0349641 [Tanacetum coccineum]
MKIGGDEIEVSDNESSDPEEYWSDKEETGKNFKIETDVFNYKKPLCLAFNEFNYLLKVDPDLLTKDIMGFKTYEDYKDDWVYKWSENVTWVYDKPWLDNGIWKELKPAMIVGKDGRAMRFTTIIMMKKNVKTKLMKKDMSYVVSKLASRNTIILQSHVKRRAETYHRNLRMSTEDGCYEHRVRSDGKSNLKLRL